MKLRVRHNSIRLRLGKSEIERLRRGMECREAIRFPGAVLLEYTLEPSSGTAISASLAGSAIRIGVPERALAAWCSSDRVGLSAEVPCEAAFPLQILIEKDFRCLDDRVEEDQSDMFENPLAEHLNCEQRSSLTGPAFVDENDVVEQKPEVFEHGSFQEHACC